MIDQSSSRTRSVTTSLHSSGGFGIGFGAARRPQPPARVSLEHENRAKIKEDGTGGDHAELGVLATTAAASAKVNYDDADSTQETVLERTQMQHSLPGRRAEAVGNQESDNADFHHREQKYGSGSSVASDDLLLSPVHSSSAAVGCQQHSGIDEENQIGKSTGSRRHYDDHEMIDFQKLEGHDRHSDEIESLRETKKIACHELDNDKSLIQSTNTDDAKNNQSAMKEDIDRQSNFQKHRDNGSFSQNHSIETDTMTNVHEKRPEIENSGCTTSKSVRELVGCKSEYDEARKLPADEASDGVTSVDEPTEFVLTTSDIAGCVEAMDVARKILEVDPSNDPFDGIDIDLWKSIFEDFQKYIAAFDDPTHATDANELHNINDNEKAYAIFDRGMKVNHCNVIFIYDMIGTISSGIDSHYRIGLSIDNPGCKDKLDHLAECIDMIFRVNNKTASPAAPVSVTISKSAGDNSTILKFCLSSSGDSNEPTTLSTIDNPSPTMLPPHLQAMSKVFAQFASETAQPLQWQVGSTRETLAATREGAKDLQRQALTLQDELNDAQVKAEEAISRQEQAEAEFARQTGEFQQMVTSFKNSEQQHQEELANLKERYDRRLEEMKAELERVKCERNVGREINNDDRHEKILASIHRGAGDNSNLSTPHRKQNECVIGDENGASEDPISQSIPRNIEFRATATVNSDMEGSRVTNSHSKHISRTGIPPGWMGPMQTMSPLRHQSPPARTNLKDERVYRGFGRTDSTTQRNLLTVIAENRPDHAAGANFCKDIMPKKADRSDQIGTEKRKANNNLLHTEPKNLKHVLKETDNNSEPSFAYQEVVRGAKRQALPGHECEECRKFLDALGKGFNRDDIVMKCSRHRARYAPQSTPPDFWRLTFADSVASKKSSDNNDNNSLCSSF